MDGAIVVVKDNTGEVKAGMKRAIEAALEECGLVGESYAKRACPVDTGRLRNSITHTVNGGEKAAYIGTNVEYARYVELGTRKMAAQPYLRPAAADHASRYRSIFRKHLQSGS